MYIEIGGDAEELVRASLSSGEFQSAEEAIAAMARNWAMGQPARAGILPQLEPDTDMRAVVAEQGVLPFDPGAPIPDFWPEDESPDEFLAFLRDVRHDASEARKRS